MFLKRLFHLPSLSCISIGALLFLSCGDGSPQGPGDKKNNPVDTIPPAAVSELAVRSPTASSLALVWIAPGDDGKTGQATAYDIRRSLSLITERNWDEATPVSGTPAPKPAGEIETIVVTRLPSETDIYFALKTSDEVQNESGLSNCAMNTTKPMAPAPITDLEATAVSDIEFRLTWTATGDDGTDGTASHYDIRYSISRITSQNWNTATQVTGEPAPKATGEPDSFIAAGLNPGTNYYFAMKAGDEVPNWSELSNVSPALALSEYLWATPQQLYPGEELLIAFRSSPTEQTVLDIWRPIQWWPVIIMGIFRHLLNERLPAGAYLINWDLLDDDGNPLNNTYVEQCKVKLHWGDVTIDSSLVRVHPSP